jgi:hypothetical protein
MILSSGSDFLEMTVRERLQITGDVCVAVAVRSAAFTGSNDEVWISRSDFEDFLTALHELDRKRRGEAELVAMSHTDFMLTVKAVDSAGHLSAEGWVGREYAGQKDDMRHRVCFWLELDPSTLPALAHQFEALGSAE